MQIVGGHRQTSMEGQRRRCRKTDIETRDGNGTERIIDGERQIDSQPERDGQRQRETERDQKRGSKRQNIETDGSRQRLRGRDRQK